MADKVAFDLVSPEQLVLSQAADMVVVPGAEGDFGVLPQHALFLSTLRPGVIDVYEGGKVVDKIFVAGGFAEVTPERLTVLAEETKAVKDLDKLAIEARLKAAKESLQEADNDDARKLAEQAMAVAEAMLAALPQTGAH